MSSRTAFIASSLSLILCAPAVIEAKTATHAAAVLTPATDIRWNDVPGFPGVQIAAVGGDPAKGPHHSMLKYAAGFEAPVHHHTTDHYGTVVAGTLVLHSAGREVRLPPGSYFAFTGKMPHTTRCEPGAECVLAIDARGKWDVVPEKEGKRGRK